MSRRSEVRSVRPWSGWLVILIRIADQRERCIFPSKSFKTGCKLFYHERELPNIWVVTRVGVGDEGDAAVG